MTQSIQDLEIQYRFYSRSEPPLDSHLGDLLNWYTAIKDDKDAREYLIAYLKEHKRLDEADTIKRVPDSWIPRTSAFMAHLDMRGRPMTPAEKTRFEYYLNRALSHASAVVEDEGTKPNVQEHIKEKISELVAEIEGLIDDGVVNTAWSLYRFLAVKEVSGRLAAAITEHYKNKITEDTELQKIYKHLAVDGNKYATSRKKMRKPRKKKIKTPEQILKNLSYLKESIEHKLASIDPVRIIGAQELWTYNPKYNLLSVYRAADRGGLSVDYTSITNLDNDKSKVKRIGRRTEKIIQELLTSSQPRSKRIFDEINAAESEVTRITKDMILLKVHS